MRARSSLVLMAVLIALVVYVVRHERDREDRRAEERASGVGDVGQHERQGKQRPERLVLRRHQVEVVPDRVARRGVPLRSPAELDPEATQLARLPQDQQSGDRGDAAAGDDERQPRRPAAPCDGQPLPDSIKNTLQHALRWGGTSLDDLAYLLPDGRAGDYMGRLRAYGREGEGCTRCGGEIIRTVIRARSSFWCPRCQV